MAWIKLQIHPEHDKVLALADLTGASPEKVFAAAVRWFRWADEHAEDASIGLSRRAFREVTRWKGDGLADAMLDPRVDWLTEESGILSPTRWETHMSNGAKVRAMDARRKKRGRESDECPETSGQTSGRNGYIEKDKRKSKNTAPPPPSETLAPNGTGGGGGGVLTLTEEQVECYRLIAARPAWLPDGEPWLDPVACRDIAALPTTTPALIAHYGRETRTKRKALNAPAGFFLTRMRNPDAGVLASLSATSGAKA